MKDKLFRIEMIAEWEWCRLSLAEVAEVLCLELMSLWFLQLIRLRMSAVEGS